METLKRHPAFPPVYCPPSGDLTIYEFIPIIILEPDIAERRRAIWRALEAAERTDKI